MSERIKGWTVRPGGEYGGGYAETGGYPERKWWITDDRIEATTSEGWELSTDVPPEVLAKVLTTGALAEELRARGWTVEEPEPPGSLSAYEVEVTITRAAWERLGSPREGRTVTVQQDDGRGSIHVTHVRLEYVKVDGDSVTLAGRRVVPR